MVWRVLPQQSSRVLSRALRACVAAFVLVCALLVVEHVAGESFVRLPPVVEAPPASSTSQVQPLDPAASDVYIPTEEGRWGESAYRPWTLQCMPDGLIYRSYMAGVKEPRFASVWSSEKDAGSVWDTALGGRLGILRYGTADSARPEGWQLDVEGAVFARLDPNAHSTPLLATDFRAGVPLTYGQGSWHFKFAYYHISSHLGDEFMLLNPGFPRINYVRDGVALGAGCYWTDALRVYGEVGCAIGTGGGAEPMEFQFGADFSPPHTTVWGSPFAAVNTHLRQEVDFGGHFVAQAGWQWRHGASGRASRLGLQYFNGKNEQYEFFDDFERKLGCGLWVDY